MQEQWLSLKLPLLWVLRLIALTFIHYSHLPWILVKSGSFQSPVTLTNDVLRMVCPLLLLLLRILISTNLPTPALLLILSIFVLIMGFILFIIFLYSAFIEREITWERGKTNFGSLFLSPYLCVCGRGSACVDKIPDPLRREHFLYTSLSTQRCHDIYKQSCLKWLRNSNLAANFITSNEAKRRKHKQKEEKKTETTYSTPCGTESTKLNTESRLKQEQKIPTQILNERIIPEE